MTSKFNFKLLPISHLAFHFQNQTPLLPAFFFKNLPFWPNSYKINPPQKILFYQKRKDMCQFRHKLTFLFTFGLFFKTFHFDAIVTKLTLPQKILFYQKRKDMCQFRHKLTLCFSSHLQKRKDTCQFCQKSYSRRGYQIRFCH